MPTTYRYLAITALGPDDPDLIRRLSRSVTDAGCNIHDSHMTVLGNELAAMLIVSGNWNTLIRLEKQLAEMEAEHDLRVLVRRTGERHLGDSVLPYAVDVVALDQPGIVFNLAEFFTSRKIAISDLVSNQYSAVHSGTPMFSLHMVIHLPAQVQIAMLREEFMDFCDQLNLDAVLEPMKG